MAYTLKIGGRPPHPRGGSVRDRDPGHSQNTDFFACAYGADLVLFRSFRREQTVSREGPQTYRIKKLKALDCPDLSWTFSFNSNCTHQWISVYWQSTRYQYMTGTSGHNLSSERKFFLYPKEETKGYFLRASSPISVWLQFNFVEISSSFIWGACWCLLSWKSGPESNAHSVNASEQNHTSLKSDWQRFQGDLN